VQDEDVARQLRNAGFPQHDGGETLYIPTLDELIEACGDDFYELTYHSPTTWVVFNRKRFVAYDAPTPKAAVAQLWLARKKSMEVVDPTDVR
jgi:hypothetical protein